MIQNPDIQNKAQDELDKVIGRDRMPDVEDKVDLPYINALIKETLRCNPTLPYAVPHGCIKDDEYKGMFIPKGSVILPNVW